MTLDDFINSTVEGADITARLRAIKALRADLETEWIEEGRRLSKDHKVSWGRIGAAVGMSARLAPFHFGDEEVRNRWRQRNRESMARNRAALKEVA